LTQDEILDALHKVVAENMNYTTWTVSTPHLVALVNLAIEREREACAKIADEWAVGWPHPAKTIALDIRARGDNK
jgi:hypothetical protein